MGKIEKYFMAISAIVWATGSWAADHRILMLDTGSEGIMVFDPPFLQIAKGDSLTFVAKDPGHNVISHLVPAGAAKWKGAVSKDFTVSFDKEGVYIYECDLHHPLGMVGVIQVGKPVNLEEARAVADDIVKGMAMGAERLQQYLDRVHE